MEKEILYFNIPENLKALPDMTKKTISYGEEASYLPLQWKKMWFRSLYPLGAIRYATLLDEEDLVIVEAKVYSDKMDPDEAYIGLGMATVNPKDCGDNQFLPVRERQNLGLRTAMGLAASKALTDAGFGLQFYGDQFDPEGEAARKALQEKSESENISIPMTVFAQTPETELPAEPSKKRGRPKKSDVTPAFTEEPSEAPESEAPESVPYESAPVEPVSTTASDTPVDKHEEFMAISRMSEEEALQEPVTLGPMKGKMLGPVKDINPNYLVFLYKKKEAIPERLLSAVVTLADKDEVLIRKMMN